MLRTQIDPMIEPHLIPETGNNGGLNNKPYPVFYNGADWVPMGTPFRVYFASTAPSSGTWSAGDICWNTAPAEQGTAGSKYIIQGWRCVSGGTPGTWLQMRTLTGN